MSMPKVPADARDQFERLVNAPLIEPEELIEELDVFTEEIEAGAERHEFNHETAVALLDHLQNLVDRTSEEDDQARSFVQAAVYYFIAGEDAEPDFSSESGMDDDVAVFNAVAEYLEHDDLVL